MLEPEFYEFSLIFQYVNGEFQHTLDKEEKSFYVFNMRLEDLGNQFQESIFTLEECNSEYKKIIEREGAALPQKLAWIETAIALKTYGLYSTPHEDKMPTLTTSPNTISCF